MRRDCAIAAGYWKSYWERDLDANTLGSSRELSVAVWRQALPAHVQNDSAEQVVDSYLTSPLFRRCAQYVHVPCALEYFGIVHTSLLVLGPRR